MLGEICITKYPLLLSDDFSVLAHDEIFVVLGSEGKNEIVYIVSSQRIVTVLGRHNRRYNSLAPWYEKLC